MVNLYAAIKDSNLFRKMEVSELLFVEYTGMKKENKISFCKYYRVKKIPLFGRKINSQSVITPGF